LEKIGDGEFGAVIGVDFDEGFKFFELDDAFEDEGGVVMEEEVMDDGGVDWGLGLGGVFGDDGDEEWSVLLHHEFHILPGDNVPDDGVHFFEPGTNVRDGLDIETIGENKLQIGNSLCLIKRVLVIQRCKSIIFSEYLGDDKF
jgi:hypothetical protein